MSKKWLLLLTITLIVNTNTPRTSAQHTDYGRGRALQGLGSNTGRPMATNNHNDSERGSVTNLTAPSSIISRVAAFPLSIVRSVFDRVTLLVGSLISALFSQIWTMMKTYVIPNVDRILMKVSSASAFPDNLRDLISQAHSAYELAKMFGYFKPA